MGIDLFAHIAGTPHFFAEVVAKLHFLRPGEIRFHPIGGSVENRKLTLTGPRRPRVIPDNGSRLVGLSSVKYICVCNVEA